MKYIYIYVRLYVGADVLPPQVLRRRTSLAESATPRRFGRRSWHYSCSRPRGSDRVGSEPKDCRTLVPQRVEAIPPKFHLGQGPEKQKMGNSVQNWCLLSEICRTDAATISNSRMVREHTCTSHLFLQ